jgi:hypothetical protein
MAKIIYITKPIIGSMFPPSYCHHFRYLTGTHGCKNRGKFLKILEVSKNIESGNFNKLFYKRRKN